MKVTSEQFALIVGVILAVSLIISIIECTRFKDRGDEKEPCFPNQTCMDGLECRSNTCVK